MAILVFSLHNIFVQSILEPDLQEVVTGATAGWGYLLTVRKFCGLNHDNSMDNFLFPQNGKICHEIDFPHLEGMALPWQKCQLYYFPQFFNRLVSFITGNRFCPILL